MIMKTQYKICTKCGIPKTLSKFAKNKACRFGVTSTCKKCSNKYQQKWREANPEKGKEYTQKYYRRNPKKFNKRVQEWRARNPEKCKEDSRNWNKKNYARAKECTQRWIKENPERKREHDRKWKKANPEKVREGKRKIREKKKTDPTFKLNNSIRGGILKSLRGNKNGRHWEDIVGYTLTDLKKHLEKRFAEGMTWEKFLNGEIHIDHKIPISVFNFTSFNHRDFKRCWALKNLQPMWAIENLQKGAKLTKPFQPSLLM